MSFTRRAALGALTIPALTQLTGCGGAGSGFIPPEAMGKTTVLIYIIVSDLIPQNQKLFKELEKLTGRDLKDLNVVIQVGGAQQADNPTGEWVSMSRKVLVPSSTGNLSDPISFKDVAFPDGSMSKRSEMSSTSELTSFLDWATAEYPSQTCHLALSAHGGGPGRGIGWDATVRVASPADDASFLTLQKIKVAISECELIKSGRKFDTIGFDSCLMASVELASILHPFSQTLVASQDLEPGDGWAFYEFLLTLSQKPTMTGAELGKVIVDTFIEKSKSANRDDATLSVTDLTKIPDFMTAVDDVFRRALQKLTFSASTQWPTVHWDVSRARNQSLDFHTSILLGFGFNLVDAGIFWGHLHTIVGNELCDKAVLKLKDAVIYKKEGLKYKDSTLSGLHHYFPSVLYKGNPDFVGTKESYLSQKLGFSLLPDIITNMADTASSHPNFLPRLKDAHNPSTGQSVLEMAPFMAVQDFMWGMTKESTATTTTVCGALPWKAMNTGGDDMSLMIDVSESAAMQVAALSIGTDYLYPCLVEDQTEIHIPVMLLEKNLKGYLLGRRSAIDKYTFTEFVFQDHRTSMHHRPISGLTFTLMYGEVSNETKMVTWKEDGKTWIEIPPEVESLDVDIMNKKPTLAERVLLWAGHDRALRAWFPSKAATSA